MLNKDNLSEDQMNEPQRIPRGPVERICPNWFGLRKNDGPISSLENVVAERCKVVGEGPTSQITSTNHSIFSVGSGLLLFGKSSPFFDFQFLSKDA